MLQKSKKNMFNIYKRNSENKTQRNFFLGSIFIRTQYNLLQIYCK